MTSHLDRAAVLINHKKYDQARDELMKFLAENPYQAFAYSLLGVCQMALGERKDALAASEQAVHLAPDDDTILYHYANILFDLREYRKSEKTIRSALEFNAFEADYFGLLSQLMIVKKDFQAALIYADKGLEIDSSDATCLNLRSMSQLKLGLKDQAFKTVEGALEKDPENSQTLANYGWGKLEAGVHSEALDHFKQALRVEPNNAWAKSGLVEALKANYFLYRVFLKYYFWMGRLSSQTQWVFILAFYVGFQAINQIAKSNPDLSPFLMPLLILGGLFAFSSWIMEPVFNLMLRFNKYGKYALTRTERLSSNFVGLALLVGLVGLVGYFWFKEDWLLILAVVGVASMLPLGTMLRPRTDSKRKMLVAVTIVILVLGFLAVWAEFQGLPNNQFFLIFLITFIAYQWTSNISA